MTDALRHRGPDASGLYIDPWVGLGHRRLSIIDLSGGTQPIHNEDESLWIVYNGEIFNYPELRDELQQRGHTFYTRTDTEVLLHLYEEKGEACLEELNGQFAFAIWDARRRELFMARDRFGIHPLFYTSRNEQLLFASEIKALVAASATSPEINPTALDQIFTFWCPLPGYTAFKDIHTLQPGHYLKLKNRQFRLTRYWHLSFSSTDDQFTGPRHETVANLQALLEDAIRIRLRADVPVGCYLSGGLDSSGVAALIKGRFNNALRTFGIRFDDRDFDEGDFQRQMVEHLHTDHTDITASTTQIGNAFPEVLNHCETPLLRTSPVPLYLLSRTVRDSGFKVVLTGEGADEIFAGYNIFRECKVRQFWARQVGSQSRPLLLARLYPYILSDPRLKHMLTTFFQPGLDTPDHPLFSHLIRWQNTSRLKAFFSDDLKRALSGYDGLAELQRTLPSAFAQWDSLAKAQYLETELFMSNYLLSSQGDRMAMAHSIEIRVPYLDHRLAELMAHVPSRWKLRSMCEKDLLRKAFKGLLPETIQQRPKRPYRAPIATALLKGRGSGLVDHLLTESNLKQTGLFNPQKVARLLQKLTGSPGASEFDSMLIAGIVSTQIVHHLFQKQNQTVPHGTSPDLFIDRRRPDHQHMEPHKEGATHDYV